MNFVLFFILPFLYASELPEWHMKPMGSHVKPDSVDETFADDIISPEDFANKYVLPRKPIVFRNIVKTWPAFQLWTDEYLKTQYGDMEMRLEAKKEKRGRIPKGDVCLGRDRLSTFLNDYKNGADKYIVSELPTPMWRDVNVPPPMACGDFLTKYVEIDIWVNSDLGSKGNGGNSILHKDAYNTVNCVVNGSKEWKLIELKYNDYVYQSWEGPMDAGYGGFSLVNPDKVDAVEFPNFGRIPRWQFVSINAGDCLYVPSQMWHQVTSYGETNRAVAFLFTQFNDGDKINTTGCGNETHHVPLSEVDVALQYPGKGLMTMGHGDIESTREQLMELVDERTGIITQKRTYKLVYVGYLDGAINKKVILQKAKTLYQHMFKIAGGKKEKMTYDLIKKLSRDEIRGTYDLLEPTEPANSYNHEYSYYLPEDIIELLDNIKITSRGEIEKETFINAYEESGGTRSFAESFWRRLAGDKLTVYNISETIQEALRPYEENRRDKPETRDVDDDATITTPQGHVSQPKRRKGGYSQKEEEGELENNDDDNNEGDDENRNINDEGEDENADNVEDEGKNRENIDNIMNKDEL